jgi:putative nucleotidyltransferase with HDIG domain
MMLVRGRAADTSHVPSLLESPPAPAASRRASAGRRLLAAFQAFEAFPALRRARDEMLAAIPEASSNPARLINVVESDPALTIEVLRAGARSSRGSKPADVPAALALLTPDQLELTALDVATYDFFEQSRLWSDAADRFRVHARATQAALEYVRRAVGMGPRPDLYVAALLHDIGKLILLRAYDRYEPIWDARGTPADRLALEGSELGINHALVGGVLARRLGLPDRLVRVIERHHEDDARDDAAIIRLADMLAHYASGGAVRPAALTTAARVVGLEPDGLRKALDELPGGGGAAIETRAATPSPLTRRETEMVRKLADGKVYKQIAGDLDLQVSTVRTHLYNTYKKLGVADRAQAVLLATSNGWL